MKAIIPIVQAVVAVHRGCVAFKALTWNAGGGWPQPEFLGGEWEENTDLSSVEQMIGVCLHVLGGCGKPEKNFESRYAPYYEKYYEKYTTQNSTSKLQDLCAEDLKSLTELTNFVPSAKEVLSRFLEGAKPDWATQMCTLEDIIKINLDFCNEKVDGQKKTTSCKFELEFEGCWKKRPALPVFGQKFKDLSDQLGNPKDFYDMYLAGLQGQDEWNAQGCIKGQKEAPFPGSFVTNGPKKGVEKAVSFESWTQVLFWDVLVIALARSSMKILEIEDYKAISEPEDPKEAVKGRVTDILRGALKFEMPDVAFIQEKGYIVVAQIGDNYVEAPSTAIQNTDTTIYV